MSSRKGYIFLLHDNYDLKCGSVRLSTAAIEKCLICFKLINSPVKNRKCNHGYCGCCIVDYMSKANDDCKCPNCGIAFSSEDLVDGEAVIDKITIYNKNTKQNILLENYSNGNVTHGPFPIDNIVYYGSVLTESAQSIIYAAAGAIVERIGFLSASFGKVAFEMLLDVIWRYILAKIANAIKAYASTMGSDTADDEKMRQQKILLASISRRTTKLMSENGVEVLFRTRFRKMANFSGVEVVGEFYANEDA